MDQKPLYIVTQEDLETGLRGIPVGYCVTSEVDPIQGLTYVEEPIRNLCDQNPMEVIYLLYHGRRGSREEVSSFEKSLHEKAHCSQEVLEAIAHLPKKGHPMDHFSAALLLLGMDQPSYDYRNDCLNVIAKLPILVAAVINHHAGWKKEFVSRPELGYIENFVQMLNMPGPKTDCLVDVMRLFNVLHYDHCGGNLSVFVGKSVASGLEHMYGSLSAAINALAGPRHGRANQDCLEFVQVVLNELGENAKPADVERLIRKRLEEKKLIFGFGHAVLKVEDPRATICYDYCEKHFKDHPLVKTALLLRTEGSKVLKENPKISDPYPNVDAITGAMLVAAGFPYPEYFTLLFGLSRMVGIAIQIVYERLEARGGKGTPIVRPNYIYKKR